MTSRLTFALLLLVGVLAYFGPAHAQSNGNWSEAGKKAFGIRCAGCHGADGSGGERGPTLIGIREPRAASPAALRQLIRTGIPGTAMPSFPIEDDELEALVAHLEFLTMPAADRPVEGNQAAGERFFVGKGKCQTCHIVRGKGGILGPDLSNVGRERRVPQIERALLDPSSMGAAVSVRLRDGRRFKGVSRYESPFDLGVQTIDGRFESVDKQQAEAIEREASLMPRLEATADEFRDLMAFLTRLTVGRSPGTTLEGSRLADERSRFEEIASPKRGEWPTYHGLLSGNRHSALDQINTKNVDRLAPAWTFQVPGAQSALQGTPLVVDGLMYVTTVNTVYALDARTGRQVWRYTRPRTQGVVGDAASGINRGVAVLGDRVFLQTDHAHLIALHRIGGQLLWDVEMADYRDHYGGTSAPLVVNDLVIAGVSGGDEGNRGFLDAYKAETGERAWRFWTVPGRGEPGSETWVGKALEHGCASTWLTGTYDPEARLLYWPTGNPCPDYNGDERQGDNLYSNSVLALDPDTGKLRWYFQFTPHDLHDWDATETPMLVDMTFRGRPRKLLLHADRNGFFYVLDRLTGEFLLAEPFIKKLTWASGIGRDGRPILLAGSEPSLEGTRTCPSVAGATNWPSMSFNPETKLLHLMVEESCSIYSKSPEWWVRGQSFYGGDTRRAPNDVSAKFLRALDVQTGKVVWEVPDLSGGILASGVMSTAGGLVFYGDAPGGAFVAVDASTGKHLWHFNTGHSWKSGPMTYMVAGRQYVAVAAGSTIVAFW